MIILVSTVTEFALLTQFQKNQSFCAVFLQREGFFLALLDLGIANSQIPIRPSSSLLLRIHIGGVGLYIPPLVFFGLLTALQPFTRVFAAEGGGGGPLLLDRHVSKRCRIHSAVVPRSFRNVRLDGVSISCRRLALPGRSGAPSRRSWHGSSSIGTRSLVPIAGWPTVF